MNMHHWWWKKAAGVIALLIAACAVFGWLVATLWNWLMPPLFGLGAITFWQALGLFVLGRVLFGGFRGFGGHHRRHRHHMRERWRHMTPQERESFSRGLRDNCGWHRRGDDTSEFRATQN